MAKPTASNPIVRVKGALAVPMETASASSNTIVPSRYRRVIAVGRLAK